MKNLSLFCYLFISLTGISCTSTRQMTNPARDNFVADGKLWTALWQQRAAEYRALCFQAYNIAHLRLDQHLLTGSNKPMAIVTDIDETVLDNSPNAVHQALKGKDYEQESWYEWTGKAACDTLAGSASFFRYAASKGVEVFYITNRDERERGATLANLRKYSFPNADSLHLLLKQTTSGKEARRQKVLKDHDIVLLLGDNLSDFSVIFDKQTEEARLKLTEEQSGAFGNKFIVLPNCTYGDWENAIFNYNYKLTPAQKEEIIKRILKNE